MRSPLGYARTERILTLFDAVRRTDFDQVWNCPVNRIEHQQKTAMQQHQVPADPVTRQLAQVVPEILYGFERQVLFSPSEGGSQTLKFAFVKGRPGARSKPHTHPGGELALTLEGAARLVVNGLDYDISANTALSVPPDVRHPAEAVGQKDWLVVTTYCDECPLMRDRKSRDRAAGIEPQGGETSVAPVVRLIADVTTQAWGGCDRKLLFSPAAGNSSFMKLCLTSGSQGARAAWQAPGCAEITLTLQGAARLTGGGAAYELTAGSSMSLQSAGDWVVEVVGDDDWLAVTGSCEECPLMLEQMANWSRCSSTDPDLSTAADAARVPAVQGAISNGN